jgi:peptidoglycan/xylan/chitin deacetylase (PgdA/CDA1 family)
MHRFHAGRLTTLYLVRPVRRICAAPNGLRIPILMYHSISEKAPNAGQNDMALDTSPLVFESHLKYLSENGYTTISPTDVVGLLSSERAMDKKYVAITFDDGYRDFYINAFPVISKYGFNATVYLPTAYISTKACSLMDRECLTWTEVRELHKAGVAFGSHTMSHSRLEEMSDADLEQEVLASRQTIEDELGSPVYSFAYPFVFPEQDSLFVHRLRDLLKATGYHDGVSKVIGTVQSLEERFFLRRVRMSNCDDLMMLKAKLDGDYDWLRTAQSVRESVKRMRSPRIPRGAPGNVLSSFSGESSNSSHSDAPGRIDYRSTSRRENR